MKKLLPILLLLVSCSPKIVENVRVEYRDSVRVEVRERIVHDTVSVEVPKEVEKIVTRDTASHIENTYAMSDAVVSDGFLYHSLESKPQIIYVPVEVQVADTTTVHQTTESEITTQFVEVEKELNWWHKFRLNGFWVLLGLLIFAYRKQIINVVRRLLI